MKKYQLALFLISFFMTSFSLAVPAQGFILLGCRWDTSQITWTNTSSAGYITPTSNAVASWNASQSSMDLIAVPPEYSNQVRVLTVNRGNVDYDAITEFNCYSGYFYGRSDVVFNTYYTSAITGQARKSLMVHEFGHVLGLGHQPANYCSQVTIMYFSSQRYSWCGVHNPTVDDINGVNSLY